MSRRASHLPRTVLLANPRPGPENLTYTAVALTSLSWAYGIVTFLVLIATRTGGFNPSRTIPRTNSWLSAHSAGGGR
jgi:hypothetical protein